jgi:hypothetical protein
MTHVTYLDIRIGLYVIEFLATVMSLKQDTFVTIGSLTKPKEMKSDRVSPKTYVYIQKME